jgi:C4-type Zn-finger protein
VFQSVEGLLRQIREQAEETAQWTEAELREITQTVTAFTKSLEQEHDPISERARMEYQRIREKLSQALNRGGQVARESAGGF